MIKSIFQSHKKFITIITCILILIIFITVLLPIGFSSYRTSIASHPFNLDNGHDVTNLPNGNHMVSIRGTLSHYTYSGKCSKTNFVDWFEKITNPNSYLAAVKDNSEFMDPVTNKSVIINNGIIANMQSNSGKGHKIIYNKETETFYGEWSSW